MIGIIDAASLIVDAHRLLFQALQIKKHKLSAHFCRKRLKFTFNHKFRPFYLCGNLAKYPTLLAVCACARVGDDVRRGGRQRRDVSAKKKNLAAFDEDVAFLDLDAAGA